MQDRSDQTASGCILVVDDQSANRELLQEILTAYGFIVIAAPDGSAALRVLGETKIDLVLMDVMMPGKNGFEVCRDIKGNPETYLTPVVLITGLSDKESRLEGIKAGADDFLTRPVDRIELLARVRSLLQLKHRTDELERAESILFSLARSIEGKDPYTHGHCERISSVSALLGQQLGLAEEQVTALRRAGIVHDIGKITVPDAILLKPGPLSSEEWILMRDHPIAGERICAPLKSFRILLPIIRHHHEKMDGSGYPDRLRGNDIPITARILAVVDVYDALTTTRPYKSAMSVADAIRILDEEVRKGWWDAEVFRAFERLLKEGVAELQTRHKAAGAGQ